jgi:hypothetical protein
MPKYMVTHTLPPKGFSRDQFCQVAVATQQDPIVKAHQSFVNLTEGKAFCFWDSPSPEALMAWFKNMNIPYDNIIKLEHVADGAGVKDV